MAKERLLDEEAIERPFAMHQLVRLLGYTKPYRGTMFLALFLLVVSALSSLIQLRLTASAIGLLQKIAATLEATGETDAALLQKLTLTIAAVLLGMIISGVCYYFRVKLMETAGRRAIASLRHDLFAHLQTLSLTYFDGRPAGKLLVRVINDVNSLNDLFTNGIVNMLVDCITLVIVLGFMLFTNVTLTAVSLGVVPLLILIAFLLKRRMRRSWQQVRTRSAIVNAYLHESLAGMRVTQAFAREEVNAEVFEGLVAEYRKEWMGAIKVNNFFWASIDVVGTLGTVLLYAVGVTILANMGADMLEPLVTMVWFTSRFWGPINNLSNFYNSILVAMASCERIFEIMDAPASIASIEGAQPLPPLTGSVTFEDVTFSYDETKVILRDVSFCVQPGQTIALVGPTGAGKSTVINLIARFYDPQGGRVLLDGHDIATVDLHSLRSQLGIMLQDSFIFSGTIMENIRYGKLDATDDEVVEAAKAVLAHDFIMQKELGYQTEVNERGTALSVGQRQLISFARALLADPRILILDEATSAIDTKTELVIQQALERLLQGRTSFVIAHRLSTIRRADCIYVIANGGIAESGDHNALMQLEGGHYKGLCEAQYRFLDE